MVFMNANNVKSDLMKIANELDLGYRPDIAQIMNALHFAVECITELENALDNCLMSARKEIMHLEATVCAAKSDMEDIVQRDDGFNLCSYCGSKTIEQCSKCHGYHEGFEWRGLKEGDK